MFETLASRVAVDAAGDVFGTTRSPTTSTGTVFDGPGRHARRPDGRLDRVDPARTTLFGINPAEVLMDGAGDLFGDTASGGAITPFDNDVGGGTLWELPAGSMTIKLLYTFGGGGADGQRPRVRHAGGS